MRADLHAFLICHNGARVIAAWLGVQFCTTTELCLETQYMICWCIELLQVRIALRSVSLLQFGKVCESGL